MAKLTKKEEHIVEMYVRYFGTVATEEQIESFDGVKSLSKITADIRKDADNSKTGLTPTEFLNDVFQNLFGRDANPKDLKYVKTIENNKNLPIATIIKNGSRDDKAVYNTKKLVALLIAEEGSATDLDLDKITKDTYKEIYNPKTKKLSGTLAEIETKVDLMKDNVAGETFTLTAGVDMGTAFEGTEKGDVFNAFDVTNPSTLAKMSTLDDFDTLDGKAGNDTLNIATGKAINIVDLNLTSIETVNVKTAAAITNLDGSNWNGTNTLNVTQATAATVTAAATTDVNVSGVTGAIVVKGGNDVVVTDATAAKAITVGNLAAGGDATGTITITDTNNSGAANIINVEGGTDVTVTTTADKASSGNITIGHATNGMATGNVVVTQNTTHDAKTGPITAGDVTVTGGKTVEITANMTNTAVKGGAATGNDITAGTYKVTAGNTTTDVTITQNATATDFENDAAGMVKETSVVTFSNMKANETLIINGLTFTASKNLTAAEVAAAFANLTADDTQSATGITANGIYTGAFDTAVWTSAAANGATVTFTAKDENETDLAFTGSAATKPTQVKSLGTAAGASTAVTVAEDFGDVVVDDNATKSITTITLDGFDTATLGAGAGGSLDKLATLNLTNGQGSGTDTVLTSTVATLNVTVDNIVGTVDLDGAAATTLKTLNLKTTGEASDITLSAAAVETLTIAAGADLDVSNNAATGLAAVKTVTISGTGDVNLGDISATATSLTSTTTGDVSVTVDNAKATVTTGSGNDTITLDNTAAISKAINLGAGDDTLILAADTIALPTAAVAGGNGTDTISMTTTSAEAYDANTNFASAISGFERLTISNATTATIEADKLGFNYVTFGGTASTGAKLNNVAANSTTVLEAANNNLIIALGNTTGEADVANVVVNNKFVNTAVYTINLTGASATVGQTLTVGGVLLFTAPLTGAADADAIAGFIDGDTITIDGVDYLIDATTSTAVTLTAQSDVTISETSLTIDGTATLPTTATATTAVSDLNLGTVTIAGVETINLTSSDANTSVVSVVDKNTLIVVADTAKTINIDGAADLDLSTTAANLKTVDASAMTGALKYTIKSSVADFALTSGSGADIITVDASNNAQVKTGAGADTIIVKAGAVSANIWGGAGNDVFDVTGTISSATQYVTIEDATAGDQIILDTTHFLSGSVSITDFDQMTLTDKFNAVLGDTGLNVDRGTDDSFAISFQHAGNTYIVVSDGTAGSSFGAAGTDQVIKLTGLKDLSAGASFNIDGTLEIA